ncbi:tripartite motif-containing protein 16-like isoform X1 [Plectropomus leopardus]|uniref:tripartite motif-containing protein 16-like isoform X1 n=1 Tax=Plectropomus leopardus TaxID=160734 RepID=UPI001C4CA44C|nr:tripartite motif-containing protein 16-like isoform X1 [Plectropomus leopardus]
MAEPQAPVRKNHLCCRICSHVLRNPATVPCGHNFCMQCIQSCWDQDQRKNRLCGCPECGSKFPSRPEVIRNTTLADLVRDIERCDDDSTGRRRHSGPSKRPWSCTETGPSSESSLCGRHNSLLDIYCCTDEQIVCAVCASAEHRGHTIGSVKEERRRKQEELKNIQTKSKQFLQKQEKTWKKMRKTLEQIQEEAKETQDYCESILVSVIDSLQRHYMSVRELIRGQGEATAAQLENSLQTLQEKMEETRKRDAELDHLAQSDSDVHFLQEWPSLRRLCEKDHLQHFCEVSEDPLLPFEFTKKAVEQLGRRLEEFCDKQFASICETADEEEQESGEETEEDDVQQEYEASTSQSHGFSGADNTVTEQDVEPKTRAEFLRYACSLSLDPTTAHVDLAISAGETEVRLSPLRCKSPVVRHPQRFIHRQQVLCREGLQADRCYYEVEVEGDKAEIALAYKGIDRKSRTSVSAFGGNANSWSLDRSTKYSVSHKGDSVQLTAQPSHHRLGVYLKFREGTLSFYEVSDRMTFLYKVEAEFTEPLYPGFWLGEKCRIRICDLRQDRTTGEAQVSDCIPASVVF